jgi:predicted lipid-binding transport protein (Tim44 family)
MFERTPVSRAVLEARRAFKPTQPQKTEYAAEQKALHDNRERLKSERLAREADAAKAATDVSANSDDGDIAAHDRSIASGERKGRIIEIH